MSRTNSVSSVGKAQTLPLVPAGTMAAPALTRPSIELRVEASGSDCPHGNIVRNPSVACGTTVAFREYACAVEGIPQALFGIVNPREAPPLRNGPPNGPFAFLVSATLHGGTGTK